jgi:hypothetical protein
MLSRMADDPALAEAFLDAAAAAILPARRTADRMAMSASQGTPG